MFADFELRQMQLAMTLTITHTGTLRRKTELSQSGDDYDGHSVKVPWLSGPRDGIYQMLLSCTGVD